MNNKVHWKVKFGNAKSQILKYHLTQVSTKRHQSLYYNIFLVHEEPSIHLILGHIQMMSAKFWDLGSSSTCHAAPLPLISSLDLSAFPWTYRIYQLTKVLNQQCCQSACFGLLGSESSTGEEVRGSCGYLLEIGRCCSAVVISSRLRLHLVPF